MKLGDLVRAKETSVTGYVIQVTGYIVEKKNCNNGFTTVGEGDDFSVHPDYQEHYLVRWFQPSEGMRLKTMQSWRTADRLELLSESR